VCKIHSAYVSKFYTYLSLTQQKLVFAYSHAKNTKEREHKHDIVPLLVFACYNFALSRGQDKRGGYTFGIPTHVLPYGVGLLAFGSTLKSKRFDSMKRIFALAVALWLLLPLRAAEAQEPPPALVKAIARQESGHNPLAVNVAGKSHYPATREEAERLIREALAAGKSFDVGKMQINSWWMERFGIDPFSLLDPAINESWGKRILAEEIARHGLNWKAVGKYHSPDPERGRQYAWLVYRHYAGPRASTPKVEAPHAQQKTHTPNLPHPGGIWRNPSISRPGRVITFGLQ
jgi:hypothetical protein